MQIELEQTGTEDGWNESWRRRVGLGCSGGEGVVVARVAATQIANIRQIFLNSGVATQPFYHYVALLLALPVNQKMEPPHI